MRPFGRAHPLDASDAAAGIVIERAIRLDEDVAQIAVAQLQFDGGVDEALERDQGRRVLVEHFVDRSPPEEGRFLNEQRKELTLALEVAVDGWTAHPGRRTDVGQARLAKPRSRNSSAAAAMIASRVRAPLVDGPTWRRSSSSPCAHRAGGTEGQSCRRMLAMNHKKGARPLTHA